MRLLPVALALGAIVTAPPDARGDSTFVAPDSTEVAAGEADAPPDTALTPAPGVSHDPEDSLDVYLIELRSQTDEEFGLEALSISDAEVDSLIRAYEETGRAPKPEFYEPKWRFDWGLANIRYNRVEGVNVIPQVSLQPPTPRPVVLRALAGYGWAMEKATWDVALSGEVIADHGSPTVVGAHARDVVTFGSGGVPGNSVWAFGFGYDYHDYFLAEGWRAGLRWEPSRFRLDLEYRDQEQTSLPNETSFSIFGPPDGFRVNPLIHDGSVRGTFVDLVYRNEDLSNYAGRLRMGFAGNAFGGDFDYETYRLDVTLRRGLWLGDLVTVRLSGGTSVGDVPFQALHHLGGFRTLRGFEVNEFPARQFAHFRFDYRFGTDFLGKLPWLHRLRLQLTPFFDGAAIFETQDADRNPIVLDDPDRRSSAGLGIQRNFLGIPGGSGQLRLDVSNRLDRASDAWRYRAYFTLGR